MKQRKLKVAQLAEKLTWSIEKLVPQRIPSSSAGEHVTPTASPDIKSLSALWERLKYDAGGTWFPTRTNWLEDVREGKCSLEILEMIREVYPELTVDLLRDPDFDRFRAARVDESKRERQRGDTRDRYTTVDQTHFHPLRRKACPGDPS